MPESLFQMPARRYDLYLCKGSSLALKENHLNWETVKIKITCKLSSIWFVFFIQSWTVSSLHVFL